MSRSAKRAPTVPLGTDNPVEYLLERGSSPASLSVAWGFRTPETIFDYKAFRQIPSRRALRLMAETFGWSPGQVLDHWTARVKVTP